MEIEIIDKKISRNIRVVERVVIEYRGFINNVVKTLSIDGGIVDERWFITKSGAIKYAGKVLDAKMQFLNLQEQRENQNEENA